MKLKPVYMYLIIFTAIIAGFVIFSQESSTDKMPDDDIHNNMNANPHGNMPNDDIHGGMKDGDMPGSGNVKSGVVKRMNELKTIVENNPDDTASIKEYANMLARGHGAAKALELYESILDKDPSRIDILQESALLSFNLKNYDKSENYIKQILEIDKDNLTANFNLGAIAAAKGDTQKAKDIYRYVINKYPDSKAAMNAMQALKNLE